MKFTNEKMYGRQDLKRRVQAYLDKGTKKMIIARELKISLRVLFDIVGELTRGGKMNKATEKSTPSLFPTAKERVDEILCVVESGCEEKSSWAVTFDGEVVYLSKGKEDAQSARDELAQSMERVIIDAEDSIRNQLRLALGKAGYPGLIRNLADNGKL